MSLSFRKNLMGLRLTSFLLNDLRGLVLSKTIVAGFYIFQFIDLQYIITLDCGLSTVD